MTDRQSNRRIYFDANAFIYAIEGVDEVSATLHKLFAVLRAPAEPAYTGELTLAEGLPKANGVQRRNYFTLILHSGLFELLPVSREILIETADYRKDRARPSFDAKNIMPKLADAVHVVSAVRAGCDTFISFDRGLQVPINLVRIGREGGHLLQLVQDMS